jgi:predicted phosphodiesterase
MLLMFDDSPAYVLGDIHGNYKDLMLFEKTFWRLGLKLCPANVLCLGDYVDRGPHSLETIAYLLAQKVVTPHKIFLIRGNHEVRDVNGDFQVYG